jgi:O-antigen ligase
MIPDNMYLSLLSESGILGLLAFLIFIFLLIKRGAQRFNAEKDRQVKLTILMPLCALAGLLVNMAAYDLFYWDNPLMLFSLICGFITVA